MIYTKEEWESMGFNNVNELLDYLLSKYINCCYYIRNDGSLWFNYDFDTNCIMRNDGCALTEEELWINERRKRIYEYVRNKISNFITRIRFFKK